MACIVVQTRKWNWSVIWGPNIQDKQREENDGLEENIEMFMNET